MLYTEVRRVSGRFCVVSAYGDEGGAVQVAAYDPKSSNTYLVKGWPDLPGRVDELLALAQERVARAGSTRGGGGGGGGRRGQGAGGDVPATALLSPAQQSSLLELRALQQAGNTWYQAQEDESEPKRWNLNALSAYFRHPAVPLELGECITPRIEVVVKNKSPVGCAARRRSRATVGGGERVERGWVVAVDPALARWGALAARGAAASDAVERAAPARARPSTPAAPLVDTATSTTHPPHHASPAP